MISASSVDRVDACPPSAVMTPRVDETGEAAVRGTAIHEFLRRVSIDSSENAQKAALSCVPVEWLGTCNSLDLQSALGGITVVSTEDAYAIDVATGNIAFLGNNIDREYAAACQSVYGRSLRDTELCLTLDLEGRLADGTPVCLDWKTGIQTKSVEVLWQMRLQSYVLSIKYDSAEVLARVVYIKPEGNVWLDETTFSRMTLDSIPEELLTIFNRVRKAKGELDAGLLPAVNAGDHCKYCPCFLSCPATKAIVPYLLEDVNVEALTITQLGAAWAKLKTIEALAEKLSKRMKLAIYKEGQIPAEKEGYVYRPIEQSRAYFDNDRARGLLLQLGATDAQMADLSKTTKFDVIRRVKE